MSANKNNNLSNSNFSNNFKNFKNSKEENQKYKNHDIEKIIFKEVEITEKENITDKLKIELNQLQKLTQEANNIIIEKDSNGKKNLKKKEYSNENKNIENFQKPKSNSDVSDNNKGENIKIKSIKGNYYVNEDTKFLEQEFEDKLNYLIDKLDVIDRIER